MKITKFPDNYNPNKILMDTIIKRNSVCPCCGENRFYTLEDRLNAIEKHEKLSDGVRQIYGIRHRRLGFQKPWYKHIFQGEKWWNTLSFKCETCGAEWESEEFPDIECRIEE